MRELILEKGYADITITDLAKRSRISVSHFLYYFPSKEAVLEEVCRDLLTTALAEINSRRGADVQHRIEHLTRMIFSRSTVPRPEFGFFLEILVLSMHYPRVKKLFDEYSLGVADYLVDLFSRVPRADGRSPEDTASIVTALWGGLLNTAMFDPKLNEHRARALFRSMLFSLAGIEPARAVESLASRGRFEKRTADAAAHHM